MEFKPAVPKEAAALIVLEAHGKKILWARRNPALKFLGGFHSFPGGKVDEDDERCRVENAPNSETARLIACAVRETFEEVGILLVRNGERLTKGQLPLLHDDLESGRNAFSEILEYWGLLIDASDFEFAGVWTTPEFSPVRFETSFFVAKCPDKQVPYAAITELEKIEFTLAEDAIEKWSESKVLMAPPVLNTLRALEDADKPVIDTARFSEICAEHAFNHENGPHFIELNSRLKCFPVRTKTLPPATHTNCYISGGRRFVVIDAASPFEDEQKKLNRFVGSLVEDGNSCEAIIVSHLHPDHFGGETSLKSYLLERFGFDVPIVAHRQTVESLEDKVVFDQEVEDSYSLQDNLGNPFDLSVLHTPGHARGHLCFYDEEFGFLLSSDNVVGQGTVVIAPPEGDMSDYLDSLEKMKRLPGLRSLAGSHGSAVADAIGKIEEYITHRLEREKQILDAVSGGAKTLETVVDKVYRGLDPGLIPLAMKSAEAHLNKLTNDRVLDSDWLRSASANKKLVEFGDSMK
ncbi:MAG: MBL fold metallo-hydrolase [Pyrinomonadaceae bacterium]|nr:MBL fold metallo-hydrolase [Pyrinomonadaceae bacterium]